MSMTVFFLFFHVVTFYSRQYTNCCDIHKNTERRKTLFCFCFAGRGTYLQLLTRSTWIIDFNWIFFPHRIPASNFVMEPILLYKNIRRYSIHTHTYIHNIHRYIHTYRHLSIYINFVLGLQIDCFFRKRGAEKAKEGREKERNFPRQLKQFQINSPSNFIHIFR